MKTVVRVLVVLLLLAALAGFAIYKGYVPPESLPWARRPPPPAPAPVPAATPAPEDLPAPMLAEAAPPAAGAIASLDGFERTVKAKRASGLAWEDAQAKMALFENDAVRTFEKSSATIVFGADDVIEVDQNALVVIKPRPGQGAEGEISLALLSADLLNAIESKPAAEQSQAIATASAARQVTIRPAAGRPGGGGARIAIRTLPDKTTSVAALSGSLKITGPRGDTVTLKEKMVTKFGDQGGMAAPRLVPGVPGLTFPEDNATYPFLRKTPRVDMKWSSAERARTYRIVVANDPGFKKIFADERVETTAFSLKNLQPGTYYWRVRAQDGDGFAGAYTAARSLRAVYDEAPPKLAILAPPEMYVSPQPTVTLRGATDSGARIKVNGTAVPVAPDGTFSYALPLKEGVNQVTIVALDQAGNAEYGKRLITYKGAKRSSAAAVGP